MESDEPILDVGSGSHFGGAAQQYPHLPGADFPKELLLLASLAALWTKAISSWGIPRATSLSLSSLYTLKEPSVFGVERSQNTNCVSRSFWEFFQIW
mgnify:CR=1 FL=1